MSIATKVTETKTAEVIELRLTPEEAQILVDITRQGACTSLARGSGYYYTVGIGISNEIRRALIEEDGRGQI